MTQKRYLLFAGDQYYPCGGFDDFVGRFETIEEADNHATKNMTCDWYQIVDSELWEVRRSGWKGREVLKS